MSTLPAVNRNVAFNRAVHPDRAWVRVVRLLLGLATLAGVGWNIYLSANGLRESTVLQTLSYFTNQGNCAFGVVLLIGALTSRDRLPAWWDDLHGGTAFLMVMTGLVYALLVAEPGEMLRWDLEWSNIMLHRVTPVMGLLGWLLITQTRRASWGRPLAWLVYPVVYLICSWVNGAFSHWYPYAFLDPTDGWPPVLATTAQVIVAFLAVAVVIHVVGELRARAAHRG